MLSGRVHRSSLPGESASDGSSNGAVPQELTASRVCVTGESRVETYGSPSPNFLLLHLRVEEDGRLFKYFHTGGVYVHTLQMLRLRIMCFQHQAG